MKPYLLNLTNNITTYLLLAVIFLIPLVFVQFTTESFESPKLVLLIGAVFILLILKSLSWILEGKVLITRTPLDIPLLLLLLVIGLSTFFSDSRYVALYGNLAKVSQSAIAWVSFILFYFITTAHFRTKQDIKLALFSLLSSATIISLATILSYFEIYPLKDAYSFARIASFTPTGSSFSTASMLILLLPFPLISLVSQNKFFPLPISLILAGLFAITLVLIASPLVLILALLIIGGILYLHRDRLIKSLSFMAIPLLLGVFIFVAGVLPMPNNPLAQKRDNFPREIQLPFLTSWKVSISTFRDAPLLGTGPSTYTYDFTNYKPTEHNQTRFWNVRFDSAFNEYLQVLATLGGTGLVILMFISLIIIRFASISLFDRDNVLTLGLSIASLAAILLLLIHSATLVSIVSILVILAMLMASHKSTGKVEELSLGINASKLTDSNIIVGDILPPVLFIPILILSIFGFWNLRNIILADHYHRLALNSAQTRALDTYEYLRQAEQLNPFIDTYRTDLAQTNFALANAIAAQKGPTEASPVGSLTDKDKQNIRQLLSQAIAEGRAATTLAPRSAQNWEILASIYRQVSGVAQNALTFALDSYGKAILQDPRNPVLRINVGGIYYSIRNYDMAVRFFTDAVNLKPDYANAYYNLSVALRDKGDLNGAQAIAERVVALLDPNSPDYKTASEYLADLKERIATGSAQQSAIKAPAAQEKSVLEKKELPDVLNEELKDKPENIASPSAVPSPTASPTP